MGLHLGGETFFFGRGELCLGRVELCLGRVKNFHLGGGSQCSLPYTLVADLQLGDRSRNMLSEQFFIYPR